MADRINFEEMRAMPATELRGRIDGLKQEMWKQRIKAKSGALQQVHQISAMRKQIAQIETMLSQQRLSQKQKVESR